MKQITAFEFVDHEIQHPDYFQGCGVAHTQFDECYTGVGDTAREAAEDALESLSEFPWDDETYQAAETKVEAYDNRADIPDESDARYHVSIRVKFK